MAPPSTVLLQTSMIALLKSNAALVATVGQEIREDNWTGSQFQYPAVRVAIPMLSESPYNGNCYREIRDVRFSLYAYAEGTSSEATAALLDEIRTATEGLKLPNIVNLISLKFLTAIPPMPEGERLWRGQVDLQTVAKVSF